jgi:hypothetical protein
MKPKDIKELEQAIGHKFRNPVLLKQALTHSSFAREFESQNGTERGTSPVADNEQLEFLGDAVLGLVTSEALLERYPQFSEGQLSKLRAYLVSEKHLIRTAKKLKLGRYLRLGHGEEKSGGRSKITLQVDALEALLAAMYLDSGIEMITAALSMAEGTSVITEGVWDNRYKYVNELRKMGAQIQVDGKTAVVEGIESLSGAPVAACDLRAGAAMVIAGLCAAGTTHVEDIQYIERGYQDFVGKLRRLGADIALVSEPDEPRHVSVSAAG